MKKTKAQAWYLDFVVGVIVFITAVGLFYVYSANLFSNNGQASQRLSNDAESVSMALLSESVPFSWNESTPEIIGIVEHNTRNRINSTKLSQFIALSESNYYQTKDLFGISSDYYVIFENSTGQIIAHAGKSPEEYDGLASIVRIVYLNRSIVKMAVMAWQN